MSAILKQADVSLPGTGHASRINFANVELPAATGLAARMMFGGVDSLSRLNRLDGTQLAKTGAPPLAAGTASFTPRTHYYDSGFQPGAAWTAIFVAAMPAAANAANRGVILMSNRDAAGDSVAIDLSDEDPILRVYGAYDTGVQSSSWAMVGSTPGALNLFAARIRATGHRRVWWGHDGIDETIDESPADVRTPQAANFLIGSAYTALAAFNDANMPIAAFYPFAAELSDNDIALNFAAIRAAFASEGVNTL